VVPLAVALAIWGTSPERWQVVEAEARGFSALLDAHGARWKQGARDRAQELTSLLAQLPPGSLGKAAEGTILLHLERRLADDPELSRYQVVASGGHILLSAGEEPADREQEEIPEVAQAAERPAMFLVRGARGNGLAVAAPFTVGGKLGGILVARVRGAWLRELPAQVVAGHSVSLVDGNGLCLGPCPGAEMARLGSETRPGRAWQQHAPSAYAPLQSTRAVAVAVGPRGRPRLPLSGLLIGLCVITLAAAGAAWLLET
jgi:hypothetical protein